MFGQIEVVAWEMPLGYDEALEKFESTKPVRGRDKNVRPFSSIITRIRRKVGKQFQMLNRDGSISYYLYYTPIVTIHPDSTLTIEGYDSNTTMEFARRALPSMLGMSRVAGVGVCVSAHTPRGMRAWRCDGSLRFERVRGGYELHPESRPPEPFEWPVIRRKEMREAMAEYNWPAFRDWLKMVEMQGQFIDPSRWRHEFSNRVRYMDHRSVIEAVQSGDLSRWLELVKDCGTHGYRGGLPNPERKVARLLPAVEAILKREVMSRYDVVETHRFTDVAYGDLSRISSAVRRLSQW